MSEIEYNPKSYRIGKWLSRLSDLFHYIGFGALLGFVSTFLGSAGALGGTSGFNSFSWWAMGVLLPLGIGALWLGGTIEEWSLKRYPSYCSLFTPDWAIAKKSELPDA